MSKLVFVIGFSGSGKSVLYKKLNQEYSNMIFYPKTYTTRLPRSNEEALSSFEYNFVSQEDYIIKKKKSSLWSEDIIHGNYYGIDIEYIYDVLYKTSLKVIMNIYPEYTIISEMENYFPDFQVKKIFITSQAKTREFRIRFNDNTRLDRLVSENDCSLIKLQSLFRGYLLKNENVALDELYKQYVQAVFC